MSAVQAAGIKCPISCILGFCAEFNAAMIMAPDKTVDPKGWHRFREEKLDTLQTRFKDADVSEFFNFVE